MAVIEIMHRNGKLVRLPYDFGETDESTIAAQQYLELFWDDICDAHIIPGDVFPDDKKHYNKSLMELAIPKDMLLGLLHSYNFSQKDVARVMRVSPRMITYYVDRYNLREYCKKMRNSLMKRTSIKTNQLNGMQADE